MPTLILYDRSAIEVDVSNVRLSASGVIQIAKRLERLKRRHWRSLPRLNRQILSVIVDNSRLGMFAHLNVALRILRFAEENHVAPQIAFESPNYADPRYSKNWFAYHFALTQAPEPGSRLLDLRIETHRDLGLSRPDDLTLLEAGALWRKYVRFKPEIIAEVDGFCSENQVGPNSIAVHYRGTDKCKEASRVSYDSVIDTVRLECAEHPDRRIFVASDEHGFVERSMAAFPDGQVCFREDSRRASTTVPIHLHQRSVGNFEMGRDALVNCLILARCGTIVRTCSLLSSWASIFNPGIDVVLLNDSFENTSWYPERVIAPLARRPRNS